MTRTRLGTPPAFPALRTSSSDAFATTAGVGTGHGDTDGLAPGVRFEQYELIRELGRGGMGVVFAARDTHLGRRVAIKFLLETEGAIAERFMIEARATAQCTHPNIVVIHEIGEHDKRPFMVLEFLEGQPLRAKLEAPGVGRLPASRVIDLMLPVARALARAAELGIVHRDLKPENVFVTHAGQVKVLDFGIAKARDEIDRPRRPSMSEIEVGVTTHGAYLGTLPYMAPEQLGLDEVDARTDLWAMGVMMWEMLAGRHPIQPFTPNGVLATLTTEEAMPAIADAVPDVPAPLARIVDLCLRKRKIERLANAAELVRRLEELLPGRRGRELADGESPYPGLAAFQEHDADRFFGREREIARMTALVRELPITAVVGPSGVGKSSFVRAGVAPALKVSGESWETVTLRPGRQPMQALASLVQRLTMRESAPAQQKQTHHDELIGRLYNEAGYLGTLLRARVQHTHHNIVLFVDQFEELYTLVPEAEERKAFTAALAGAADDTAAPVRVIVSMRSDFLERVAEDPHFLDEVSRGLLVLGATERTGLRDALVKPLEMVGYAFDAPAVVEEMLDELSDTPGALPLLQFIASKLWDARDTSAKLVTERAYRSSGGVLGALAAHADAVVASLSAPARALAPEVFRRLVTPERTRASAELADLEQLSADRTVIRRLIDQLVAARLLVVQARGETAGASVELVHESLLDRWPTLRRWLDEATEDAAFRAQLSTSAKQWDAKGRSSGLVWRGEAAEEAHRWATTRRRELPEREHAFIEEVLALRTRARRGRRMALVGAFVVLGAIAGGASFGWLSVRAANAVARANEKAAKAALAEKTLADKKREDALTSLMTAEQLQKAAEQGVVVAEKRAEDAQKQAEDAQRQAAAAQAAAAHAQAQAHATQEQVAAAAAQMTREQLVDKNKELEAALAAARSAREKAERETAKAEEAAAEAKAARAQLQAKLDEERARVQKLEEQKKQISTHLK